MHLRPPWAGSPSDRQTPPQREIRHPRLAALEARVCLVECYDAQYTRVFGPYPRPEAVERREAYNRTAADLWHYELWEDFDDTERRLEEAEPFYGRAHRWHYLLGQIAHETAPVYVVRVDRRRAAPPYPILETMFGPVPRRIGNHATCPRIGVLDWVADRAAESVFSQPPAATAEGVLTVWTSEWRQGAATGGDGPKGSARPPEAEWPSGPEFEAEPELLRWRPQ